MGINETQQISCHCLFMFVFTVAIDFTLIFFRISVQIICLMFVSIFALFSCARCWFSFGLIS
jgi:hypothetical protein